VGQPSPRSCPTGRSPPMVSGPASKHRRPARAHAGGVPPRERGPHEPPLPSVATTSPEGTTPESRGTRWPRGLDNARLVEEGYCVPSGDRGLTPCALATLVVVMEGRVGGRGCLALRCHVISKGRAVPRAGRVRHRPTGPGPAALPRAVVARRSTVSPEGAKGGVLGDGAWAGTAVQDTRCVQGAGLMSARRPGARQRRGRGRPCASRRAGACLRPGRLRAFHEVSVPREAYGPRMGRCGGATGSPEPRERGSHLATAEAAGRLEHKRWRIATLCADQTSRGGQSHTAHRADPQRLSRC